RWCAGTGRGQNVGSTRRRASASSPVRPLSSRGSTPPRHCGIAPASSTRRRRSYSAYAEPFALRALGIVRNDERLVDEAHARFAALGLDWDEAQTPSLMRTAKRS